MRILDVCCGPRGMWFDKNHPGAVFGDKRVEDWTRPDTGRHIIVKPTVLYNFVSLPFNDNQFKLVVFDPPHLTQAGENGFQAKTYGLFKGDWKIELSKGFVECMRVLEPGGTLIFKWNEVQHTVRVIVDIIGFTPLFGHKSGKAMNTHWLCFMKE